MTDPRGPIPVREPKRAGPAPGDAGFMNGFLAITTAVSLVLLAGFLAAGVALPFISPERKDRR